MKHGLGLGLALVVCGIAEAADPPSRPAPATGPAPAVTPAKAAKRLDLRIGDVRKYMMPKEYRATIQPRDPDADTVVVEGARVLLPSEELKPVPGGIMAPFWAIRHPTKAWRLFVPDVNAPALGPPASPVPPPVFRWGP